MGVIALSAGCSWVLPEPLPFTAENVEDAMIEDAAPPRPDFMIAPPVDLGQRFDMRPRRMDQGAPIDEGVAIDMGPVIDMEPALDMGSDDVPVDEGVIEVDQSIAETDMAIEGLDASVDGALDEVDMRVDMALDPEPDAP